MESPNSTCHTWTHRIQGRILTNDETYFEYFAMEDGDETIVIGTCSGCGAEPCGDHLLQGFRECDRQLERYCREGFTGGEVTVRFLKTRNQPLTIMETTRCHVCYSRTHPTAMCLRLLDSRTCRCPICRSSQHDIGDCPDFDTMNPSRQVQLLVADRAGLPPLGKYFPWWDYLHRWMNDPVSENKVLSGFAWSANFAKEITLREGGQYVKILQAVFDKDLDRSLLPVDETTRTINGVYTNLWCPANVRGWVHSAGSSNQ
ncbi:uncharacterized protein FPRO_10314 [Fusarium proliferatum ET1]|uniref:Uncharacterized protein n=1 Tax=Fusarium proliferatum (strain ET1) TaxID=1227346 RepID=A0A1L7VLE7_FUSPR|nr:uncharacterized protein FPRO_10314 [Fusarium proliferatum ET1]CZR40726.1 uncharacterized protein FPRO_10314 [Fusarium proliferatum ET1]